MLEIRKKNDLFLYLVNEHCSSNLVSTITTHPIFVYIIESATTHFAQFFFFFLEKNLFSFYRTQEQKPLQSQDKP
jgi:hypothetical protein